HLQVAKLVLNQEHVGALTLDAVTHGQEMVVTGRSAFEHAILTIDGNVGMHGNLPGVLDVQFRDLDIDRFLTEEIKGQITAHSAVAGRVHVAGPFRRPQELSGGLNIDNFHVEFDKVPLQTDGPIEVALHNGTLDVRRFAMSSADTELKLGGTI